MNTATPPRITETMEQVHRLFERYLALHQQVQDIPTLMQSAIAERYGADVEVADVLKAAEENSLQASRNKILRDPKTNPIIDTSIQNDLFDSVALPVPTALVIDGKVTPYYEASIMDGLEYWKAKVSALESEKTAYEDALSESIKKISEASARSDKTQAVVNQIIASGIDPRTVRYAKKDQA